jgi:hypothetical protein
VLLKGGALIPLTFGSFLNLNVTSAGCCFCSDIHETCWRISAWSLIWSENVCSFCFSGAAWSDLYGLGQLTDQRFAWSACEPLNASPECFDQNQKNDESEMLNDLWNLTWNLAWNFDVTCTHFSSVQDGHI